MFAGLSDSPVVHSFDACKMTGTAFIRPGDFMLELEPILGYLNFAEGRPDPRFQRQLNDAYAHFADAGSATPGGGTPWIDLRQALQRTVDVDWIELVHRYAVGEYAFVNASASTPNTLPSCVAVP